MPKPCTWPRRPVAPTPQHECHPAVPPSCASPAQFRSLLGTLKELVDAARHGKTIRGKTVFLCLSKPPQGGTFIVFQAKHAKPVAKPASSVATCESGGLSGLPLAGSPKLRGLGTLDHGCCHQQRQEGGGVSEIRGGGPWQAQVVCTEVVRQHQSSHRWRKVAQLLLCGQYMCRVGN